MDKQFNITGTTIINSGVMNLGEINGNVLQAIQKLPAESDELKTTLNQLQTLINSSSLSDSDKQEALTETKTIAETAAQPKEEQNKNIIRKTLRYFKGLTTDLESIPETAVKLGQIIDQIAGFWGL